MRRIIFLLLTSLIVATRTNPAAAQWATGLRTVLDNCQNANLDPDPRIAACDQLIHANIASHGVLAALYNNRGAAYEAKKDVEHAAQDYEKALALKSDFPEAQTNLDRLKSEKTN
jgi:lipoprotein NlpI